jgi:hypothetical protein
MTNKITTVIAILALVVSGVAMFQKSSLGLGGLSFAQVRSFPDGLRVGRGGQELKLVYAGTCTLVSDSSIAATSTGTGTCAISGLLAGDIVDFRVATTSTAIDRQIVPIGVIAGTNSATVRLLNLTGTAKVPGAVPSFGSSSPYKVFRYR